MNSTTVESVEIRPRKKVLCALDTENQLLNVSAETFAPIKGINTFQMDALLLIYTLDQHIK